MVTSPGLLLDLEPFAPPGELQVGVRAEAVRRGTVLALRYVVDDDEAQLRFPEPTGSRARVDRLWEHTCLEAFVAPAGLDCYWEVNFSPGGDWNIYRFDGYRRGMAPEERVQAPAALATLTATAHSLSIEAAIDLGPVPELARAPLDLGLAAVLETVEGRRSYWALRHVGAQPDFHARDTFALRLAEPSP